MKEDQLFRLLNLVALCGWLILAVLQVHRLTLVLIPGVILVLLSSIYVFLIVQGFSDFKADSFSTLSNVMALFTKPGAVLAGWVHYLAFDLFTGLIITYHAASMGISRWLILPCLFFTFMFGPAGWLMYYLLLCIMQKSLLPNLLLP